MPKFSEKCNLLSQYLEENVTFGDENFRILKRESQTLAESSRQGTMKTNKSLKQASFRPPSSRVHNKTEFKKLAEMESGTAQMTLLYGGQILVFDDFPADKVQEILSLAGGRESSNFCGMSSLVGSDLGSIPGSRSTATDHHDPQLHGINFQSRDVPIARRVSLHQFLEKRKDRVAKSSYHVNQSAADTANLERNPFLNMEHQPLKEHEQLDLKL